MVIEKIIGKLPENIDKRVETVQFEWFEASQKILRKLTSANEEIGLRLNEPIFDGAVLYEDESRVIAAELAPSEAISIKIGSAEEMGRACYEAGNLHLALFIGEGYIMLQYDSPAFERFKRLGFACHKAYEKFMPNAKGYPHG